MAFNEQLTPPVQLNGFQLAWVSTTTLTVAPGVSLDANQNNNMVLPAITTINAATVGVNGLDTGALAASSNYAVFVIGSSLFLQPTATLISLSPTAPVIPAGYDILIRVGWAKTDGSSHFLLFYQTGNRGTRQYQWDVPISVLSGGAANTFTAVALTAGMPPQASPVILEALYTPNLAANSANIRPTGSSAAVLSCPVILQGSVATVALRYPNVGILPLLATGVPSVDYIVGTTDALTLTVVGYTDFI